MKFGWVVLLLLAGVIAPGSAKAQSAAYGDFSISDFTNLRQTNILPGASLGLLVGTFPLGRHVEMTGDIQGRFLHKSGLSWNGVAVGPRFQFPMQRHGLAPYAEFLIGYARINSQQDGMKSGSTDSEMQVNGGVAKRLTAHWDADLQYSYAQYYALGGEYNPKTFSLGVIYHFTKR